MGLDPCIYPMTWKKHQGSHVEIAYFRTPIFYMNSYFVSAAIYASRYCVLPGFYLNKTLISASRTASSPIACAGLCGEMMGTCGSYNYDKLTGSCQMLENATLADIYCQFVAHPSLQWYSPLNCRSPVVPGNQINIMGTNHPYEW